MSYSYMLSGTINAYPIKAKCFKDYDSALRYLDKIVINSELQIENVFTIENTSTFVANNYSRFTLAKIA